MMWEAPSFALPLSYSFPTQQQQCSLKQCAQAWEGRLQQ